MAYIRCSGNIGGSLKVRTASGNPCTFTTDLADALVSLTADIVAKQDLHGYDHPWAGGAGKNKLNPDYRDNTSNNIKFYNGVGGGVALQAGQAYTISVPNGSTHPAAIYLQDYSSGTEYTHVYSQRTLTYTPSANCNIKIDIYYSNSDMPTEPLSSINVQLEVGNTATSYEPYSNICPIVGHTELNLTRCGVNLLDASVIFADTNYFTINADGSVTQIAEDARAESAMPKIHLESGTYTISRNTNVGNMQLYYSDNGTWVWIVNSNVANYTFTLTKSADIYYKNAFGTYPLTFYPQIEVGSTATAYEPYNGQTYTVQFGQTVYGGVYDKSGRLTITHVKMSGVVQTLSPYSYTNIVYGQILKPADSKNRGTTGLYGLKTSMFVADGATDNWDDVNKIGKILTGASYDYFWIGFPVGTTLEQMQTISADNELVYELATPIVIDVPSISVFAVNGVNNIVSDCGGDVNVSYLELIRGT